MEPFLVFRRTGRGIAIVLAGGFGGGTLLLGVATTLAGSLDMGSVLPALKGYFLAALPFFVLAAVLVRCSKELWVLPDQAALRMLTFRPWLLKGPRVEQAQIGEYSGICTVSVEARAEKTCIAVALMLTDGDTIPVREFDERQDADTFVGALMKATGLPHMTAASMSTDSGAIDATEIV